MEGVEVGGPEVVAVGVGGGYEGEEEPEMLWGEERRHRGWEASVLCETVKLGDGRA